jgi:ribonuclease J
MVDTIKVATELGYLKIPEGILVPLSVTRKLPAEEVVLMTTGSQGEPTSALVRIAKQEHRDVNIMVGDTVIISATPIPGNELPVSHTIDRLLRQGAKVLYDRIATVHVHGHASQEELKLVLRLVRPKYFLPVHGEFRHLTAHAQLAWDLDVAKDGIFVMVDGDVLELTEDGSRMDERISAGPIYIDGLTARDDKSEVFSERRSLSKDGVVVVVVTTSKDSGEIVGEPVAVSSGFLDESETGNLFEELSFAVAKALSNSGTRHKKNGENGEFKAKVKETARGFIASSVRRSPMIVPVVLEV